MVQLGAGKDRGWFFLPEVDDEVLIAFEHGDMDRPVIIGALWNGKDKPPKTNPGSNPIRTIVSRSGSKVELDDEKGTITISDGGGKGELVIKADDGKMTITAKTGDVTFDAPKGDVQIVCDEADLQAKMNFEVRGKQNVSLSGASGVTYKASGPMAVFGATTDINPGGTQEAQAASTSPADSPDPAGS
jgi:uncharacterized protein involved in type VI secretion and phage assembly